MQGVSLEGQQTKLQPPNVSLGMKYPCCLVPVGPQNRLNTIKQVTNYCHKEMKQTKERKNSQFLLGR